MTVEIKLTPEKITGEDLSDIYRLFCEAFQIKHYPRADEYLKTQGLQELRDKRVTGYSSERSLFKAWYEGNGITRFNGCSTFEDPTYTQKIEKFRELMKEKYKEIIS